MRRQKATGWSEVTSDALPIAMRCARGIYQRGIVEGRESLSGSTLTGKAREWGGTYARSRANLIDRMRAAGLAVSERRGDYGARILVVSRLEPCRNGKRGRL